MILKLSDYLGVPANEFEKKDVFNALIGLDTKLFLDPQLLNCTSIPEFKESREKMRKHYDDILVLLSSSTARGDRPWKEAKKRLVFRELPGVAIGYGSKTDAGNGVSGKLSEQLLETADELVKLGIKNPYLFELLGLLEEGFGADRISDMTLAIIHDDVRKYTQRIARELKIRKEKMSQFDEYCLPVSHNNDQPLLFIPKAFLRNLPVATCWDDISHVVAMNERLRKALNQFVGKSWKEKITKRKLKDAVLRDRGYLETLLGAYEGAKPSGYDFDSDPEGKFSWLKTAESFSRQVPLALLKTESPEMSVEKIVMQFKKLIELNGLNKNLYFQKKPLHENYAQRLFYAIADSYCSQNDLDLNAEPNSGNGPVDFKISKGYRNRILVEMKLSSNSHLLHGYETQLETYAKADSTTKCFYVVIRVTQSMSQINRLARLHRESVNGAYPKLVIIDGRRRNSASKR